MGVRLWGLMPGQKLLDESYRRVYEVGLECTDLMARAQSAFDLHFGQAKEKICHREEEATDSEDWVNIVTTVETPGGALRSVFTASTAGKPGYDKEYLLKEPSDIKKLLSVAYEPYVFCADEFFAGEAAVGERGITRYAIDHAAYGLQRLIGPENFALWSVDCRGLYLEVLEVFTDRIIEHVKQALDAGIGPVFGGVGPEICIPPLMGPRDFEDFVFSYDKQVYDLIHERGGYVWIHCHGKMGPMLERFCAMGVDVLNPIEPAPMGDVSLAEAFGRVEGRMGLEGNIETHELYTASKDRMVGLVREAVEAGRGRRFILSTTSGYMEDPSPSSQFIENLATFIEEGSRCAEIRVG